MKQSSYLACTGVLNERERFLPDFRSLGTMLGLLLLGELLAFMFTLTAVSSLGAFWSDLGLNSLFIIWVALISQSLLALVARPLDRMKAVNAGVFVFGSLVCASLLVTWLSFAFSFRPEESSFARGEVLSFNLLRNSVLAALVAAVGLRYQYVQYQLRLQARAEGSARLDALQARMRPHFLFNSLNSIASLTRRNPRLAEELTLDLAELFRAILRSNVRLCTLEEELMLSRQYLNIETQRLGERLRVEWELDNDLMGALIPPLSLQPLIENAVYHGVEPSAKGGTVAISCFPHKGNRIILTVRNSIPSEYDPGERKGNRIALKNLGLRLKSFFGDDGKLMTSMADGFYLVRIIMPHISKPAYESASGG